MYGKSYWVLGRWRGASKPDGKEDPSPEKFQPENSDDHTQTFAGQHRLELALVLAVTSIHCALAFSYACFALRIRMLRTVAGYHLPPLRLCVDAFVVQRC